MSLLNSQSRPWNHNSPSVPSHRQQHHTNHLRLFSFIDRSNIGNANIAGLSTELGLEGTQYNIALLIFYIPYIIADVPSNWLVKRFRAGVYLPTLITLWGLVCTFMGFTKSFAGLVVCRALLGLFEGGILGGVIIYLAFLYLRHQMLLRSVMFYCSAPLSGAFGGLLASGLSRIEVGDYARWPWIFFSKFSSFIPASFRVCADIVQSRARLRSSSVLLASSSCLIHPLQRAFSTTKKRIGRSDACASTLMVQQAWMLTKRDSTGTGSRWHSKHHKRTSTASFGSFYSSVAPNAPRYLAANLPADPTLLLLPLSPDYYRGHGL